MPINNERVDIAFRCGLNARDLSVATDLAKFLLDSAKDTEVDQPEGPPAQRTVNERLLAALVDLHARVVALERVNALALRQSADHRAAALARLRS